MYSYRLISTVSLLLALLLTGCEAATPTTHTQPLLADIAVTKQQLIIKNGDPFVWKNVTITLDGKYTYSAEALPRGGSSLALNQFLGPAGEPYAPGLLHLRRIKIYVSDTGGGPPGEFHW